MQISTLWRTSPTVVWRNCGWSLTLVQSVILRMVHSWHQYYSTTWSSIKGVTLFNGWWTHRSSHLLLLYCCMHMQFASVSVEKLSTFPCFSNWWEASCLLLVRNYTLKPSILNRSCNWQNHIHPAGRVLQGWLQTPLWEWQLVEFTRLPLRSVVLNESIVDG